MHTRTSFVGRSVGRSLIACVAICGRLNQADDRSTDRPTHYSSLPFLLSLFFVLWQSWISEISPSTSLWQGIHKNRRRSEERVHPKADADYYIQSALFTPFMHMKKKKKISLWVRMSLSLSLVCWTEILEGRIFQRWVFFSYALGVCDGKRKSRRERERELVWWGDWWEGGSTFRRCLFGSEEEEQDRRHWSVSESDKVAVDHVVRRRPANALIHINLED